MLKKILSSILVGGILIAGVGCTNSANTSKNTAVKFHYGDTYEKGDRVYLEGVATNVAFDEDSNQVAFYITDGFDGEGRPDSDMYPVAVFYEGKVSDKDLKMIAKYGMVEMGLTVTYEEMDVYTLESLKDIDFIKR